MNYRLVPLQEEHYSIVYQWDVTEPQREFYTCRPTHDLDDFEIYAGKLRDSTRAHHNAIYCLVQGDWTALGRIEAFDFNPRNKSMEFGYYLPLQHRGRGLGTIMLRLFLTEMFANETLLLNKLYATTAEHNMASVGLLQKFGFHLDGILREHYWTVNGIMTQWHFSLLRSEWSAQLRYK